MDFPICNEPKKCFAKFEQGGKCYCNALTANYPKGKCPFCKADPNEKPRKRK